MHNKRQRKAALLLSDENTTTANLETTGRLVVWRINSLDAVPHTFKSQEFVIGKWYWVVEFQQDDEERFILRQCGHISGAKFNNQFPIASFEFHVFCSKGFPKVLSHFKQNRDMRRVYKVAMDMGRLHERTPVTISFEFFDLKIEVGNDGETCSIWDEEFLKQNPSNEPILSRMLSESICTDILINARDGSTEAHRAVLAANSPVFKAMFSKEYKEDETSTVDISDMSIGACKAMINFAYGKMGNDEFRAHKAELIIASDKYDIAELKKVGEVSLCTDVGAKNVFERLIFAHTYELLQLKEICLLYLVEMGMIFKLREEYNSFLRAADPELVVLVSNACMDAWEADT